MLRLLLLPLLLLYSCYSSQPIMHPYEVSAPNPGITTDLKIDVASAQRVIATLTLTNTSNEVVWLYKPILCEGAWEESYFVRQPNNGDQLEFLPARTEQHVDAYPKTLITGVVPRLADSLYIKLSPGQTYVVHSNLSEAFDFTGRHGEYWAIYSGQMPLMRDGKQAYQLDDSYPSLGPLPVYFYISSADQIPKQPASVAKQDPYRSYLYVHFALP